MQKELIEELKKADAIIDRELLEKEDWEICAYCGEDSREEYREKRRTEILYPNTFEGNRKAFLEFSNKMKSVGFDYITYILDALDEENPYLKRACVRRKNYLLIKRCFPPYFVRQKQQEIKERKIIDIIFNKSKDFDGENTDKELMSIMSMSQTTFYRYKRKAKQFRNLK